jgi:hypothetical protein
MVSEQDWVDSLTGEPSYLDRRAFIMFLALHAMDTILVFITISGALIQEGISAVGLITQRPMWRAHEDMSRELTLDVIHYGS